jgi:hypothetical protein
VVSALASLGALAGCRNDSRISPEPPGKAAPTAAPVSTVQAPNSVEKTTPPAPKRPATAPLGQRDARATPNAANGSIEIVIADRPTECGPHKEFPATCEPAWRIRIDLPPEQQQPGEYLLGDDLTPFSYRDAQGKSRAGAWEEGVDCANLGGHFDGVLEIAAIDATGITGNLTGAGEADGPFHARRCPSCKGTGLACSNDAECCNNLCQGTCKP